ncbi:MAG: chromate transporter [Victivallales bacterium]|jgi:chromate transporter|nr:chromate transporter [Victivallales bacterium]
MTLWAIYWTFFKFGLLCFGGGYMLVPLLSAGLVGTSPGAVLTPEAFANLISIAQVTPGPVGINTATYVGFTQQGVFGAILGTLGIVTPALGLVILAVKLLKKYEKSVPVQGFLAGMRPASFGLVLSAAVIFAELSVFRTAIPWGKFWNILNGTGDGIGGFGVNLGCALIAIITVLVLFKTKFSFVAWLLICALFGVFFCR